MLRIPCLEPPRYDLDTLLDQDLTASFVSFDVVAAVYEAIEFEGGETYRPDSVLFMPEVVVRDITHFDTSMGNGFSCCLGYSGGLLCFFRGLRALRIVGHKKGLELAEAVWDVLRANGVREPSRFPDDPLYGECDVDWDKELKDIPDILGRVESGTSHLDPEWWSISHNYGHEFRAEEPPLQYTVCQYLDASRELLRKRKE